MYYLIKCPVCENSETEKLENANFIGFKCCDCGYEFSATEAMFEEIDDYEIRKPAKLKSDNRKVVKVSSKLKKTETS